MWHARTKNELIIEVWEKLDCENVGSTEIEAIEIAVAAAAGYAKGRVILFGHNS